MAELTPHRLPIPFYECDACHRMEPANAIAFCAGDWYCTGCIFRLDALRGVPYITLQDHERKEARDA